MKRECPRCKDEGEVAVLKMESITKDKVTAYRVTKFMCTSCNYHWESRKLQ